MRGHKNEETPMAKPKNGNPAEDNDEEVEEERELPKLTAAQKKELFTAWDAVQAKREKARAELEKVEGETSAAVQRIVESLGTGPFRYKGKVLIGMHRKSKDSEKATYFFRGESQSELQEIA